MVRVAQALVFLGVSVAGAQTSPGWTPLDWMMLKLAESPVISPDAGSVVYRVLEPDWERKTSDAHLFVVSTTTGETRQITTGQSLAWAPAWSPDGRTIAFIGIRGKGAQIYSVAASGGEPVQVTNAPNGVDAFKWSPDGSRIAYLAGEGIPRPDSAGVQQSKLFRVVGRGSAYYSAGLWIVPVSHDGQGQPQQGERLTIPKDFNVDDAFNWSPDGTRIAFCANDYAAPESFRTWSLYVADVSERKVRRVGKDNGPQFYPVWSPDGREIAFRTYLRNADDAYFVYSTGYVAVVPATGGEKRVLSEQFDETPTPLAWTPEGIYFQAKQGVYVHLFLLNPASRTIRRITEPARSIKTTFSFSRDFKTVAFLDSTAFPEVYASPVAATATAKRLTSLGDQLRGWSVGTREMIRWTSADGLPIEGVLIKPKNFDPSKKYPLLVVPHTGPLGVDQPTVGRDFPYNADLYAMRGILVLRPNYRGSIGYGARFKAALVRNQGLPVYEDLITGVDHLIKQGFVDSTRVGAAGWSAGAHPVIFGSVWENRFRAVSVLEAGIDWRMFYTLGIGAGTARDYALATPWDDPEYYRATAPWPYIKRARTPTLIQHGDADNVAPIAAAYELNRALLDQGVPVRMVVFAGLGHVPSTLEQVRAIMEQNLQWFEYWLLDKR